MGMIQIHTLRITPNFLSIIAEIDEFKGAWRALGSLAPERLSALRRVATIESIGSSTRIEGSRLSDQEVQRLLSNLDIQTFSTRDEEEVAGYAQVMDAVFASWRDMDVTENHIRQLHRDLLRHSGKDQRHRGAWKTAPNSIAAFDETGRQIGVVFETATPFDTPGRMVELIDWYNTATRDRELHPLLLIGVFVVVFLEIHPFQDGNGRLSRILTTLLLLRAGYAYVPYSSLESVIEQSKEAYYLALRQTQGTIRSDTPDWGPWLGFFLFGAIPVGVLWLLSSSGRGAARNLGDLMFRAANRATLAMLRGFYQLDGAPAERLRRRAMILSVAAVLVGLALCAAAIFAAA